MTVSYINVGHFVVCVRARVPMYVHLSFDSVHDQHNVNDDDDDVDDGHDNDVSEVYAHTLAWLLV